MGLADDLLEDAHGLADKGIADQRQTLMRRSISTAYYAAFHLFIEDFVEHWDAEEERARLGRMFSHTKMCTGVTPKDKRNPTTVEQQLQAVIAVLRSFRKTGNALIMIAAGCLWKRTFAMRCSPRRISSKTGKRSGTRVSPVLTC